MSLKTAIVLTVMVLAGAFGDVMVSKGMKQVGEIHSAQPHELLRVGVRAARNPNVITGVLGLAVYFFSFSAVLSWADVSLVVPISALSFLLTTYAAQRALGEHVTPQRWAGTLLIVLGVVLVARSQATAQPPRGQPVPVPRAAGEGDGGNSEGAERGAGSEQNPRTRARAAFESGNKQPHSRWAPAGEIDDV